MDRDFIISPYSLPLLPSGHKCTLCPHKCELSDGDFGQCLVRAGSSAGILFIGYGKITNLAIEPIEKRPLYHFMPGAKFLSVGGYGCNLQCDFCENWKVSQTNEAKTKYIEPLRLIEMAKAKGAAGICFTYNEPTMYAEYILEIGKLMKYMKMPLVLKTNAMLNADPWREICSVVTAMNIDHKGRRNLYVAAGMDVGYSILGDDTKKDDAFSDEQSFVLRRIEQAYKSGVHIEVSIPVHNSEHPNYFLDIKDDLASVDTKMPIHLLKIVPAYKSKADQTSLATICEVMELFKRDMKYVYTASHYNTKCCNCGEMLIKRSGLSIEVLDGGECPECDRLRAEMSIGVI